MYLTQCLHRALQQYPDRLASVFGDRSFTFAEHVERVSGLAGGLKSIGVERGDRVAMLALNSDRYLEYLMATPWVDAVLVPVNTRWSLDEIADSFDDCGVSVLFVDHAYREQAGALADRCETLKVVIAAGEEGESLPQALDYEALVASAPVGDARRCGDELAVISYTGGTTGRAKGVMLSHANLMTSALGGAALGYVATQAGVFLHNAPMFHLADLAIWATHSLSGSTHIAVGGFDAAETLAMIEQHRVTDTMMVPTMIQMLIEHPDLAKRDVSSLRRLAYGASPIAPAVLDKTLELFPDVDLVQAYGMTELSPCTTYLGPDEHRAPGPHRYSQGRAAPHSEVQILDPDDEPVPTGTVGEICSRGGHVMLGYWNRPEETKAALRGGWMHSGDLGYFDEDGYLFLMDRAKDMIISGGENVYSAEVEKVLAAHPAVAQCVVVGLPDERYGERVHAVVILAEGASATPVELRDFVGERIARYKAPRSVSFVENFPLSGAGKVLKRQIREKPGEVQMAGS